MTDRKFGIAINTSFDGKGFDDTKKAAAETEQHARKSARAMAADYEEAFDKIRNASAIAFAGLTTVLGLSVREAGKQEDALHRARAAVEISGQSWDDFGGKVQSAAARLQRLTRYGDDEALAMFADLTLLSGDAGRALEHMGLAADVAAGLHMDLGTASRYVALALSGEVGMLTRYVPALRGMEEQLGAAATAEERAAFITQKLGAAFGGLAEREAQSLTGQMHQAKNAISDAAEELGNAFLPLIRDSVNAVTDVAQRFGEWTKENQFLAEALGTTALAVTGVTLAAALLGGTVIPAMLAGAGHLLTAWKAMELAILAVRIQMLAIPGWGWALAGVAALAGVGGLVMALGNTDRTARDAATSLEAVADATRAITTAQFSAQDLEAFNAALEKQRHLVDLAGNAISDYSEEKPQPPPIEHPIRFTWVPPASVDSGKLLAELDATHNAIAAEQLAAQTRLNEAGLALEKDKAAAILAEDQALRAQRTEIWQQTFDGFMAATQSVQAAYQTAVGSMVDMEMTGKERREAIWDSFKQTAVRQIADVTRQHIFGALARQSADRAAGAVAQSESMKAASLEIANSARVIAAKIQEIAAKIYGFYASLGPFGIPAAAATMAGIIAAIRALKFQAGGLVPGSGFGDRVPALLEPGEFVIRRPVAQRNLPALQALNAGQTVNGGNTYHITVNAAKQLSYGDMLDIRRMVEEMLPRALENLIDRRALRSGWPRA